MMLNIADLLTFTFSALLPSPKSMKAHQCILYCLLSPLIPGPPLLIGLCFKPKNIWPQQLWTLVLVEANFSGSDFFKHYPTFCTVNLWGLFFTLFNHQMTSSLEETHDPVQLCNVFLTSFSTSVDLLVLVVFSFVTWVYLKSPCSSLEKDRYKPGPVDRPGSGRFPVCPPGCSTCVTGMCDSVMGSACSTLRSSAHATFTIWWRSLHWINSFCSLFLFVVNGSQIFKRRHDRLPKDVSQSVVTQRCREALRVRQGNTKVILQDTMSLIDWS